MGVEIITKEIRPRDYVGVRRIVKPDGIGPACAEILPRVGAWLANHRVTPDGQPVTIYHSVDRDTGDFDIQPGFFVVTRAEADGDIATGQTAGGDALSAVHVGPYETLGDTWHALFAKAEALGRAVTKSSWEIYVDDPGAVDPRGLRTQIFVPIDP